ncbi:MAG: flagellar hook-length control protein FliK [Thermoguttaceae bacterium]
MMRLNLDNLSTLSPLDMFSAVSTPANAGTTGADSFVDHLDRAWQTAASRDDDSSASDRRSDSTADSRRSSEDRTSPSDDAEKPARSESRNEPSRRAEERGQEHQASEAAEARAAEEQTAKERDEEAADEKSADEEAAAAELAAASSTVQDTATQADSETAAEAAEATGEIAAAGSKTTTTLGNEGLPGIHPATQQATAPAEGELPTTNQSAGSADEENTKGDAAVALPDVTGTIDPTASGETVAESGTEPERQATTDEQTMVPPTAGQAATAGGGADQGASDGSGTPSDQNADALAAASELRTDARRQVDRQKDAASRSDDQASEASPNAGDAVGQAVPVADAQQGSIEPLVATTEVRADTADSTTSSASTDGDGEQKIDSLQRTSTGDTQRSTAASHSEKASGVDQADRVRFVQRVARAVESMGNRDGTIRMALSPPELGSLKLQLTVRDGTMEARVEVETEGARSLLMDNLPALRERLAEHNIKVERFDVGFSNQSSGGSSQGTGQQSQSHEQSRGGYGLANRDGKSADAVESRPRARRSEAGRLDVLI